MLLAYLVLCAVPSAQAPADLAAAVRRAQVEGAYDVLWVVGAERSGRFEATHPAFDMRAAFDAGAVEIAPAGGAWRWSLRLVALSRGDERVEIDAGELHVEREVVRNSRASLDERFVNHRAGLEHAIAIAEPLDARRDAPLELHLSLETDLTTLIDADMRGAEFHDDCGRAVLSYRGLFACDAAGRRLPANMRVDAHELVIDVDDSCALYPIDIDPLISTSETKLIPATAAQNTVAGESVAIDGDVAAVGLSGPYPTPKRVAIFERAAGVWTQTATIIAEHAIIDLDGDWLLTARWDSSWCGDVAMFRHVGNAWVLVQGVSSPDCTTNCFPAAYGFSADLDGLRAVVGDPEHVNCGPHSPAAVYVFEYSASFGVWRPKQEIFRPISVANFGDGVALDGDDLLITSRTDVFHYHYDAALAQFMLQGTVFTGLKGSSGYGEEHPVSLRNNVAILGDHYDNTLAVGAGAAHIIERFNGTWQFAATLHSDSLIPNNAFFGRAIAFDGSVAAFGDPLSDVAATDAGAVQLYARNGGWTRAATVTASDAAPGDAFGSYVSLDRDAAAGTVRLHAGAPHDDDIASNSGASYVVELVHADALVYCTAKINSAGCVPRVGFSGTPSLSSALPFAINATNVVNQRNGVFFYGTSGRAAIPFQDGFRCAQGPTQRTGILFSNGNPTGNDCSGVFSVDFNAWLQSGADPNLVAGSVVDGQFWYRDGPASFGTGLSEAIEFAVQP